MATVYVSSTFLDLRAEREAARLAIVERKHLPGGMETYDADDSPVADYCIDDIQNCSAYVLIVGWRYGWRPKGSEKSITELEYEAAEKLKIPRLVYLMDDATEPVVGRDSDDRKRIRAFRERLSNELMAGRFTTPERLQHLVYRSLERKLGPAVEFPPEARLTCDRHTHKLLVVDAWRNGVNGRPPKRGPIVVLAFGEPEQGFDYFALRMALLEIPKLPRGPGASPPQPEPYRLGWCDVADPKRFASMMQTALLHELSNGREDWDVPYYVNKSIPLVASVDVPPESWRKKLKLIQEYAESWFRPPLDTLEVPTIVLVKVCSAEKAIATSLEKLATRMTDDGRAVFALRFDSVEKRDALAWANEAVVQKFCRQRDASDRIDAVFRNKARWEMVPLMKKLEVIAHKLAEGVGGGR